MVLYPSEQSFCHEEISMPNSYRLSFFWKCVWNTLSQGIFRSENQTPDFFKKKKNVK